MISNILLLILGEDTSSFVDGLDSMWLQPYTSKTYPKAWGSGIWIPDSLRDHICIGEDALLNSGKSSQSFVSTITVGRLISPLFILPRQFDDS